MKQIQTLSGFLHSENELIDTSVADHYKKDAYARLKVSVEHYLEEPKKHLDAYRKHTHTHTKASDLSEFEFHFQLTVSS